MNLARKIALAIAVVALLTPSSYAFLWFRDKFPSHWTQEPVRTNGDDPAWRDVDPTEDSGVDFRALNDATSLYLRMAADDDAGRAMLTGTYRQDVTVWFMGPDLKTRAWGILIPFSRMPADKNMSFEPPRTHKKAVAALTDAATGQAHIPDAAVAASSAPAVEAKPPEPEPEDQGVEIQLLIVRDDQISSAPFVGSGVDFESFGDHRHPVYQFGIPLVQLPASSGKPLPFDVVTGRVSHDVQRQFDAKRAELSRRIQAAATAQSGTAAPGANAPPPGGASGSGAAGLAGGGLPPGMAPAGNAANGQGPGAGSQTLTQDQTSFDDFELPSSNTIRMAVRLAAPPNSK